MLKSRRQLALPLAVVVVALVALVPLLAISGPKHKNVVPAAANVTGSWTPGTVHPHPHVVIALDPGESPPQTIDPAAASANVSAPPPDASTGGSKYEVSGAASSLRPPSDAEVRRELKALRTLGAGGGYVNPFSHVQGLVPERIDMGIDYAGSGPVLALGSGRVFNTAGPGWPGGHFIGIVLDSGPYARLPYYIAEDIMPTVRVGQHVVAGQVIGVMYNGGSGIETGWASGRADEPLAAALHQEDPFGDPGGWSSAAGLSFDRVLVGAGAPSGIPEGQQSHGKMPPGYPAP